MNDIEELIEEFNNNNWNGISKIFNNKIEVFLSFIIRKGLIDELDLSNIPYDNAPSEMKSNTGLNIFMALRPVIAFYVVMLAPIYGIGLPLWFESITDFSTLKNRLTLYCDTERIY